MLVIKSIGRRVPRINAISLFWCDSFKKDRTSSFRKSTLKSTRGDPLRSRIFPWVISPVGRYLMHFYRFIYSSSTFERAFPSLPQHHRGNNNPPPAFAPFSLSSFSFSLFLRTYPPTFLSLFLCYPPIRLFLLFSSFQLFIRFSPPPLKQNERRARLVSIKEWINVDWKGIKKHVRVHTHNMRLRRAYMSKRTCAQVERRRICTFVCVCVEKNKLKSAIAVVQSKFILTNADNWIFLRYLLMDMMIYECEISLSYR